MKNMWTAPDGKKFMVVVELIDDGLGAPSFVFKRLRGERMPDGSLHVITPGESEEIAAIYGDAVQESTVGVELDDVDMDDQFDEGWSVG